MILLDTDTLSLLLARHARVVARFSAAPEAVSITLMTRIEVLETSDGQLVVVGQPEAPSHHSDRHAH